MKNQGQQEENAHDPCRLGPTRPCNVTITDRKAHLTTPKGFRLYRRQLFGASCSLCPAPTEADGTAVSHESVVLEDPLVVVWVEAEGERGALTHPIVRTHQPRVLRLRLLAATISKVRRGAVEHLHPSGRIRVENGRKLRRLGQHRGTEACAWHVAVRGWVMYWRRASESAKKNSLRFRIGPPGLARSYSAAAPAERSHADS
jgi:hypothetical protein